VKRMENYLGNPSTSQTLLADTTSPNARWCPSGDGLAASTSLAPFGVLSPFRLRSNATCSLVRTESFASKIRNVRNGSRLKPLVLDFPRAAFSAPKEFSRKMAMTSTLNETLADVTSAQLSEELLAPRACAERTQMETDHPDT
jgi:hypothetical protein